MIVKGELLQGKYFMKSVIFGKLVTNSDSLLFYEPIQYTTNVISLLSTL